MLAKIMALRWTNVNRRCVIVFWAMERLFPDKRVAATSVVLLPLLLPVAVGGKLGAQFKSHSHGDFRAGTTLTQLLLHTGHEAAGAGCASVLGHRGCIRRRAIAGGELHQQLAATGLDGHRNIASLEAQPAAIELHQKRG